MTDGPSPEQIADDIHKQYQVLNKFRDDLQNQLPNDDSDADENQVDSAELEAKIQKAYAQVKEIQD